MAIKILQIDLQNDITPQIGSYDNAGGVTPNNWRSEDGVYSLGPTNGQGTTPYYWFTPIREVTDFDLCWEDYQGQNQTTPQYHLEIGDSAGNVVLSAFWRYSSYSIGPVNISELTYQTWHKILVEVRKASASSSTVTVYVDGKKVATGTSDTLITSAKIALLGHVPDSYYWQNAGQRLRYVTIYDRSYSSKGVNLDGIMTIITGFVNKLKSALSTVAFSGSYNDLSDKPTISTVNNGTLTIQQNGTNVQTFTANQSTNATANITVPTKTSDLTNDSGFITEDNTKIPLAGSNQISGSLIPSTNRTVDLGSSTNKWKSLNGINPGALSLPSSTYINVDTTNWDLTCQNGQLGSFTPTTDGWLMLQVANSGTNEVNFWVVGGAIRINNKSTINTTGNSNFNVFTIPVAKDTTYIIFGSASEYVVGRSIKYCRFMPCQGNV